MATIVLSNFINDEFIDRVYQNLHGKIYLIQKDGTIYKGKLKTKKINNIKYTFTEDGRFFDNCGIPTEKPKNINIQEELKNFKKEIKEEEINKKFEELKNKI
tara:strand:+ start:236 stop:541 length:306 start_codon:yes stop_codon:yes gene_type:complete